MLSDIFCSAQFCVLNIDRKIVDHKDFFLNPSQTSYEGFD